MSKLDIIKNKGSKTINHELRMNTYHTCVVEVKKVFVGYGCMKKVTFKGLFENQWKTVNDGSGGYDKANVKGDELYDKDSTFICLYNFSKTNNNFEKIKFGSMIALRCKPTLTEYGNGEYSITLSMPRYIEVTEENENGELYSFNAK